MGPPATANEVDSPTRTWSTAVVKFIGATIRILALAASEWLPSLLDQPTKPPFSYNARFRQEIRRSARLIVFTLLISGVVIGGVDYLNGRVVVKDTLRDAFGLFIIAIIIALVYKPFSYLTRVRVCPKKDKSDPAIERPPLSMRQVTFSVLYTFVPWLPILAFIAATVVVARGAMLDFLLIAPFICFAYMNYNFYKAIRVITNCSRISVLLSLIVPIVLSLLYIFWLSLA